jgi:hypothetical protein
MRDKRGPLTPRRPLFSRRADRRFHRVLLAAALAPLVIIGALMTWVRLPVATGQTARIHQPVAFDHRVHAGALAIDCRYCHADAERSSTAGLPPTEACVGCHQPAYLASSVLAAVRTSLDSQAPVPWRRVHTLPDFVYFDHSVHVANGVGCETCHGRVDRMREVVQTKPLTMQWCLDCHRAPEPNLRPQNAIATMGWHAPAASLRTADGAHDAPIAVNDIKPVRHLVNCSACHR